MLQNGLLPAYGSDNVDKKQTYIPQVLNCCKIAQIKKHNNTEWIKSHPYVSRLLMFISDYEELLMNVSTFEREMYCMWIDQHGRRQTK